VDGTIVLLVLLDVDDDRLVDVDVELLKDTLVTAVGRDTCCTGAAVCDFSGVVVLVSVDDTNG